MADVVEDLERIHENLLEHELRGTAGNLRKAIDRLRLSPDRAAIADERFAELKRAQCIIHGLKEYRERLLTLPQQLEPGGRARIKESATPPRDAYDEAVLLLVADYEKLIQAIASSIRALAKEG